MWAALIYFNIYNPVSATVIIYVISYKIGSYYNGIRLYQIL